MVVCAEYSWTSHNLTSNFIMSCLCQRQIQKAKCTFLLVYSLHMVTWGFLLVLIILIFTVLLYLTAGFPWSCPFLQSTASWYNRCRWCIRWCSAPKDRPRSILSTSKLPEICLLIQKIASSTCQVGPSVLPCHWNFDACWLCRIRRSLRRRLNSPMLVEQSLPWRKGRSRRCPLKLRSCS